MVRRLQLLQATAGGGAETAHGAFDRDGAIEQLAALKESHREALLLVGWDGLTTTEAAEAAGVKPSAFRTRLHRARRELESSDPHRLMLSEEPS